MWRKSAFQRFFSNILRRYPGGSITLYQILEENVILHTYLTLTIQVKKTLNYIFLSVYNWCEEFISSTILLILQDKKKSHDFL